MSSATLASPRWCTPRNPANATYGPAVEQIAAALGGTMLPWQREAAHTMGEVRPDGRMVYSKCVLIVPRRGGKTWVTLPTLIQRACITPSMRCWYTAQTQSDAEDKFREDWLPMVEGDASSLRSVMKSRKSNGKMRLNLSTGSQIGIFAPTEQGVHGKDIDVAAIDEAWAFDLLKGQQIEAAVRPAMLTRTQRQLIIISAGGTQESEWLLYWRALGRKLVEEGGCEAAGTYYCEFYPPGELDDAGELRDLSGLGDPELWLATHPALGHTAPLDALAEDFKSMDLGLFARSYLNVFSSLAMNRLLPGPQWEACVEAARGAVLPDRPVIGYDVEHDRSEGAITAVAMRPDGRPHVELRWTGHVEFMADQLQELRRSGRYRIVADGVGPSMTVTAELVRRGVPVDVLSTQEACVASAELVDRVKRQALVVTPEPRMDRAALNVGKRDVGDQWVLTRKGSGPGVAPITAAAPALLRALRKPAERMAVKVLTG